MCAYLYYTMYEYYTPYIIPYYTIYYHILYNLPSLIYTKDLLLRMHSHTQLDLSGAGLGGEDGAKVQEIQLLGPSPTSFRPPHLLAGHRRVARGATALGPHLHREVVALRDDQVQRVDRLARLIHAHRERQLKRLL